MDLQGTPYDYCSIMHYSALQFHYPLYDFRKKGKYKGLGCTMGQSLYLNADMSVLDVQEINTKYQCGKGYSKVGDCMDYINKM